MGNKTRGVFMDSVLVFYKPFENIDSGPTLKVLFFNFISTKLGPERNGKRTVLHSTRKLGRVEGYPEDRRKAIHDQIISL